MVTRVALALCLIASPALAQSVIIQDGATEEVLAGAQIVVAPEGVEICSGTLRLMGTLLAPIGPVSRAQFLGPTAGVPIDVESGGTLDCRWATLENLTTLTLHSGARLQQLKDTEFTDLPGLNPGIIPWIDLSFLTSNDRASLPFSFNLIKFTAEQGSTRTNVKAGANTPKVTMLGDAVNDGNRWGAAFETDPSSRIGWAVNVVQRFTGTVPDPGKIYPTIDAALKDPTTDATKRLKVMLLGAMVFIDENINWNDYPQVTASGPKIELAHVAPMSGLAFYNSAAGTDQKGILIRSVIARGGVTRTTAKNCTIFDPIFGGIKVENTAGTNLLVGLGFDKGTGNPVWTTSWTEANDQYFRGALAYDLHIRSPGADAKAVDTGTTMSYDENLDVDGEAFGFDNPPPSTLTWDLGADEMIYVAAPALVVGVRTLTSIDWLIGPVSNETGYNFYTGAHASPEPSVTPLGPDSGVPLVYTEPGLTENQKVTRHVHGKTVVGDWDPSPDVTAHAAVHDATTSDFSLSAGLTSVWVIVTAPPNGTSLQTGVQIERKQGVGGTWGVIQSYAANYTLNDTGLTGGQQYFYRITFRNGDAVPSAVSGELSATPGGTLTAPIITTPTKKTNDNTPIIAGTHPTEGAKIKVWIGGTALTGTATVSGGAWSIHSLSQTFADGAYTVVARETNVGETQFSNASNSITVTVDTVAPDAPASVSAVALNAVVKVQWSASRALDLRGYNVWRRTGGGAWTKLNTLPVRKDQTQYCDNTAANGTTYDYKVTAVDDALNEKH